MEIGLSLEKLCEKHFIRAYKKPISILKFAMIRPAATNKAQPKINTGYSLTMYVDDPLRRL